MMTYKITLIAQSLKEICRKFELTKTLVIKKIKHVRRNKEYVVTLSDSSRHIIEQTLMNKYIESLGDEAALQIAGHLLHSIEQEESAFISPPSNTDDYWEGDVQDAMDYFEKEQEKKEKQDK